MTSKNISLKVRLDEFQDATVKLDWTIAYRKEQKKHTQAILDDLLGLVGENVDEDNSAWNRSKMNNAKAINITLTEIRQAIRTYCGVNDEA